VQESQTRRSKVRRQPNSRSTREILGASVPPHNLEAERAVLGGILRDNFALTEVLRQLHRPDLFYVAGHQKIFQVILEMFESSKPIDAVTLAEELARKAWLTDVGGHEALVEILEETLTAANVTYYARIVHDKAMLRQLIDAGTEILRDVYDGTAPAEELLAEAEKRIFAILQDRLIGDAIDIKTLLKRVFDRISARHGGDASGIMGVPSGFADLDELTIGWQNSELIILAARPSIGKTALALNMAEHAAVDYHLPTLIFSLEMSQEELAERLLCSRARVNSHLLRKGRLGSEGMHKLIETSGDLDRAPLYIDDTPGRTILQIAATARRLMLRAGLRLIIIDYLQLIEPDDRAVSRQEQISTISRRLKNLARELKVPVIALSQLNRAPEAREGHRPRMSDLRESGSIEQDADVVTLLHRDDAYDSEKNPGVAEVIVAKQRNGPVGEVKLSFLREFTRFENCHIEPPTFAQPTSEP
jgi:replicative DNA helicase